MAIKRRGRKAPITAVPFTNPSLTGTTHATSAKTSSRSSRKTQSTISQYHTLLKRRRQLLSKGESSSSTSLAEIDAQLEALGGLDAYQKASQVGQTATRGGDSGRVLVPWLEELGWGGGGQGKGKGKGKEQSKTADDSEEEHGTGGVSKSSVVKRVRLLEIGAVRHDNYAHIRWVDNSPIDINSQHPDILQQDFFVRPLPDSREEAFDAVSCSLVLNFVDDPHARGRMLTLIHSHLRPSSASLLFLVLPLPCVNNSRYLDRDRLIAIMSAIGFDLVRERWKPNGKVGYWLWSRRETISTETSDPGLARKVIVRDGPGHNNFAICL